MADLFDQVISEAKKGRAPLAEQLRPETLEDFMGQENFLGEGKPLRRLIESDQIPSMILWGPPGSGKTTLARIIAKKTNAHFYSLSAVLSGVKDLREIVEKVRENFKYSPKKTILFIDEIHRFNKSQQDALLPHVEDGTITLIGATTENPSFEVIGPLLSRTRVFVLEPLTQEDLKKIFERGIKKLSLEVEKDAADFILQSSEGDARRLLNTLEIVSQLVSATRAPIIDLKTVAAALQKKTLLYDKGGEEHYNIISAFIKSMRASDPDAAVYYLARMYEAGEDPRFIARRMVIFAAEDVGLADPQALTLAVSVAHAYDFVGQAEGWIPLAEGAVYLAKAPKGNASYMAYKNAKREIEQSGGLPVPLHLRNAPTSLMKELGYGKNYKYAHTDPEGSAKMKNLPEKIQRKKFYPTA